METTKLSAKGQVVLPKGVRDAHGWKPGVEFIVETTPAGVLLRPKSGLRTGRIADLAGMLKRPGRKPVSLKAMDAAVAAAVKFLTFDKHLASNARRAGIKGVTQP